MSKGDFKKLNMHLVSLSLVGCHSIQICIVDLDFSSLVQSYLLEIL